MKTIYTLILALFFLTACQTEKKNLTLNLEKGETYTQVITSKATITQIANGQELKMIMSINATLSFLVQDINENQYNLEASFDTLNMSMQMPQGTMNFSSKKDDENDMLSSVFKVMTSKSFKVVMNKTGKIVDIKNIDLVWDDAINTFDALSPLQKGQLKAQIMKAYGAEALKGSIEMVTAIYPENGVNLNDTWSIDTNIESGMPTKIVTDFEFTEAKEDYALIKGNATITTKDKDTYVSFNGIDMKYDLAGTVISEIKVDEETGWILEADINQEIKGDAFIKESDQMPNGLKIPMQMINETHITN